MGCRSSKVDPNLLVNPSPSAGVLPTISSVVDTTVVTSAKTGVENHANENKGESTIVTQGDNTTITAPAGSETTSRKKTLNLMKVAKLGNIIQLKELYDNKTIDFNQRGMWDSTPLIYACQYGHSEAALFLINVAKVHLDSVNERGASALLLACIEGMLNVVRAILRREPQLARSSTAGLVYNPTVDLNLKLTPLLAASTNGHAEVVQELLEHGADVNGKATSGEQDDVDPAATPLFAAITHSRLSTLQLLLDFGAQLKLSGPSSTDSFVNTALLLACEHGPVDAVKVLLSATKGISNGLEWIQKSNYKKMNALHWCATHGQNFEAILDTLLEIAPEFDVNLANDQGETPLFIACSRESTGIVRILLQHGADPSIATMAGVDPYTVAKRENLVDIVKLLEGQALFLSPAAENGSAADDILLTK